MDRVSPVATVHRVTRVAHACSDLAHMHEGEETEERQGRSLQGGRRWGDGMGEGAVGA